MKPPISYYGGKQRMSPKIVPLIPRHTVYVEPFAGGAAVLFAKPWPNVNHNNHYREVLNDKDQRIINFYEQLRDNGQALCDKLALTQYSEAEHKLAKDLNCEDKLEAARRYYINSQQSFSKQLNAGWGRDVYSKNSAATWAKKVNRLPEYIDRMAGVFIACDDALKIIKQWDSPQTFFYCDPPYPHADQGHYAGYTIADFQALVDTLKDVQGSFILSNYDQPDASIPADWERFEFQTTASSLGRVGYDRSKKMDESEQNRKRIEVVWRRFNRVPVREEVQKLYDTGAYDCFAKPTQELF